MKAPTAWKQIARFSVGMEYLRSGASFAGSKQTADHIILSELVRVAVREAPDDPYILPGGVSKIRC